jgi:hypothetical protein
MQREPISTATFALVPSTMALGHFALFSKRGLFFYTDDFRKNSPLKAFVWWLVEHLYLHAIGVPGYRSHCSRPQTWKWMIWRRIFYVAIAKSPHFHIILRLIDTCPESSQSLRVHLGSLRTSRNFSAGDYVTGGTVRQVKKRLALCGQASRRCWTSLLYLQYMPQRTEELVDAF